MKFEIILNGVKVIKEIPVKWEDVSFEDFLKLDGATELKAASVFTGISEDDLRKAEIRNLHLLINSLKFLKHAVPLFKLPKKLGGFDVPTDISFSSFGQYVDLKEELDKEKTEIELLKKYPFMCAIYCTQPYDFKEAELKVSSIMKLPCTEVLAVGNFLLAKLIVSNSTTGGSLLLPDTPLKKLKLALRLLRSRLAFTVRFFFWKRKHRLTGMNLNV